MAAQSNSTPDGVVRRNPSHHQLRQHDDDAVLVGGDVPIAVWRLDDCDDTEPAAAGSRLASRLAQRLVLVYTRRGDAVADFGSDAHLEHATARTSRTYLPITDPGAVADLDTLTEPVSLVIVRWPPRHTTRTPASVTALFAACRLIMTADTCAIAVVSSAAPGQPGTTYAEHLDEIMPAARAAGMTRVLHIVAVTGSGDRDQFTYYASRAEADAARQPWPARNNTSSYCIDLLVFTRSGQHD